MTATHRRWLNKVPEVTLSGGAIYTASQYINQANTQSLDAWTRFDVGGRYTTRIDGHSTTFRATVQNVFDRRLLMAGGVFFAAITLSQGLAANL